MWVLRSAVIAAMLLSTHAVLAEEIESGVKVGGKIGTYSTTKCGGIDDGVKVGKSLCYT